MKIGIVGAMAQEVGILAGLMTDRTVTKVASAVVRQGLLFRQQELLQTFRRIHPEINRLQFRINPELGKKSIKK